MFCLLLALQFFTSVICYNDNNIKILPNRYINENSRTKRAVYINGIVSEDVEKHLENERRSALANATIQRSARSMDKAQNLLPNNTASDKAEAIRLSPNANLTVANRWGWDITDLLNRLKPDIKQEKAITERYGAWDTIEVRKDRENTFLHRPAPGGDKHKKVIHNRLIYPSPSVNLTAANRWDITDILNRQNPATDDIQKKATFESHAYPSPSAKLIAANRWDITDLLNRQNLASDDKQNKATFERHAYPWDITELLSDREKPSSELLAPNTKPKPIAPGDPAKLLTTASLKPGQWKSIKIANGKLTSEGVKNEENKKNGKKKLRWRLNGDENANLNLNNDEFEEFNVVEYLISDYLTKHPEAKPMQRIMPKRHKHRNRRFNLYHDLLQLEPPKDLILKTRESLSESTEVPVNNQGSSEDQLSVQPQPYEYAPLTDEEHQCTSATDGVLGDEQLLKSIKLYLENDQSTGMMHIDTRRVCPSASGIAVKACDKVRPYVFLVPNTHFEFDVMVVRIQHKKSAPVTIAVSCSATF